MASINAALKGAPGIAVGNVVGSNIANIFLVLGIAALIFPLATNREAYRRDGPALILATAILVLMVLSGEIGRIAGAIGVALLVAYTSFTWWSDRRSLDAGAVMHGQEAEEVDEIPQSSMPIALLMGFGGLAAVLYGADLLVDGAIGYRPEFRPVGGGDRADHRGDRHLAARTRHRRDRGLAPGMPMSPSAISSAAASSTFSAFSA